MTRRPALLFPGAGVQMPQMCAELAAQSPAASAVLDQVGAAAGIAVRDLCTRAGKAALLPVTASYPAIFATSVATWAAYWRPAPGERTEAVIAAGHSLGHFAALVAAGALDIGDAAVFVARRAALMQEAALRRPGSMLAILGPTAGALEDLVHSCPPSDGAVVVGCYNAERYHVLSGDSAAVDWVAEHLDGLPVDRTVRMRTGLAAHSPLMRPARDRLLPLVRGLPLRRPSIPVLLNTTGDTTTSVSQIRADLEDQVAAPVQWLGCWQAFRDHAVGLAVDVGPGDMLQRLTRAVSPVAAVALNGPASVHTDLATLRSGRHSE